MNILSLKIPKINIFVLGKNILLSEKNLEKFKEYKYFYCMHFLIYLKKKAICVLSKKETIYRTQTIIYIIGELTTQKIFENKLIFYFDIRFVFFDIKNHEERAYIQENSKNKHTVLDFTCGIGSFAVPILKKNDNVKKYVAMDINPCVRGYLFKNLQANKIMTTNFYYFKQDYSSFSTKDTFELILFNNPYDFCRILPLLFALLDKNGLFIGYAIIEKKGLRNICRKVNLYQLEIIDIFIVKSISLTTNMYRFKLKK